ncbi:MAG TPA: DUF2550 domain-containing protein [Pseudonocardiaceae bacterium]
MGITGYVGVLLIVLAVVLACYAFRRLRLLREGGIHVALRRRIDDSGRGWQVGVGRYRGDEFVWYRVLSVRSGPDQVIPRIGLEIEDRREPSTPESYAMPVDATVLRCRADHGEIELAFGADALTGFLSWLEASPPGSIVPWAS